MRTTESDVYVHGFDEDVQQNEHNTYPECSGRVTTDVHETVCDDCGLVLDDQRIDRGPEWRSFDEETRRRTGAPRTAARHDNGLATEISSEWNGRRTNPSPTKRRQFARLRTHHDRAKFESKRDRNRAHAFTDIRRMVGALGLHTSHRDQACTLFESAQQADLLRGRSLEAFASASIYAVCRFGCGGTACSHNCIVEHHDFSRG